LTARVYSLQAMVHPSSHAHARAVLALALLLLSFTLLSVAPAIAVAPGVVSDAPAVRLAYVTGTAHSPSPLVWIAAASGLEPKPLGPGGEPLLAPDGQVVAAALFGATANSEEAGPSLAIYSASGAPATEYLSLATVTSTPLAWSPDSRYLAVALRSTAVNNIAQSSGQRICDEAPHRGWAQPQSSVGIAVHRLRPRAHASPLARIPDLARVLERRASA